MGVIINGKQETANILNGKPFVVTFYCANDLEIEYCYTTLFTDQLSFKIETQNAVKTFLRSKKIYGEITVSWYPIIMGAVVSCKDNCTTVILNDVCASCKEEKLESELIKKEDSNRYCLNCLKSF
jgi:hypothetical protein